MATVSDRLKKIVVEQLGVDENEISPSARFVNDLGADSLDLVELIMSIEEEFSTPAIFTNPANVEFNTIGLFIRRTDVLEFDDGSKKNSPFSSFTTDYDVFNFTEKYISLKGWTVEIEGDIYTVDESLPNRTVGIIQCNLKDG